MAAWGQQGDGFSGLGLRIHKREWRDNILFWIDEWHPKGVLLSIYPHSILFGSGIPLTALLSFVITDGHCCWPPSRSPKMPNIQLSSPHLQPSILPDSALWVPFRSGQFLSVPPGTIWECLTLKFLGTLWFGSRVCFLGMLSLAGLLCWIDSLLGSGNKFNPAINLDCIFCGHVEFRDHLFFSCSYSAQVWTKVAIVISVTPICS